MRIIRFTYVLAIFFICSCGSDNEIAPTQNTDATYNQSTQPINELKEKIYHNGDVAAYNELLIHYYDSPEGDFLFWALIMANKHGHPNAYLDVYYALSGGMSYRESEKAFEIDERTDKMMREYLQLAVENGADNAVRIQKEHFEKYGADSTLISLPH